jgi:hypothetical protein
LDDLSGDLAVWIDAEFSHWCNQWLSHGFWRIFVHRSSDEHRWFRYASIFRNHRKQWHGSDDHNNDSEYDSGRDILQSNPEQNRLYTHDLGCHGGNHPCGTESKLIDWCDFGNSNHSRSIFVHCPSDEQLRFRYPSIHWNCRRI